MLRIFLSTSHLSALFMALHAKKTHSSSCTDILLIESPKMKQSLVNLIHDTSHIHKWNEIHDFALRVSDVQDMKPSFRKTFIRKLKTKPIAKQVYNILYSSHVKKESKKLQNQIHSLLQKHISSSRKVELNLLMETTLNPVLKNIFPEAKVRYFEHGLGDYLFVENPTHHHKDFYCVFSEQLKKYLDEKNIKNNFVFPVVSVADFENASREVIKNHPDSDLINTLSQDKYPSVLILMESVEIYNVKKTFWGEYMERCIAQISNPNEFIYLLKPHPTQSLESIEMTKSFFENKNLKYKLLDQPALTGMSAEVLFSAWKNNIHHVFALFSSSVFYLSALYPDPDITYHYSCEFMAKHISDAPEQYKKHFIRLKELIEKVFSANCQSFS